MSDVDVDTTIEQAKANARQLPDPAGFRLLCMVPKIEEEFGDTGLLKPGDTIRAEEHTTVVLFVAKMGPEAYADKTRFPNGPHCKVGDFVITRSYTGTRLKIHGCEFRIINDDNVEATIEDPRGIGRA
jgi:co-chaperonin GroES (HSP10)